MPEPARHLHLWVPGVPVTQGSKRHVGAGRMVEASRGLRDWRDTIAWHARAAHRGLPLTGAVTVELGFWLPRPAHHHRPDGTLTPSAPRLPTHKQDVDKLARAALDALTTAAVWLDDGQVVSLTVGKQYAVASDSPAAAYWADVPTGAGPGVSITVAEAHP